MAGTTESAKNITSSTTKYVNVLHFIAIVVVLSHYNFCANVCMYMYNTEEHTKNKKYSALCNLKTRKKLNGRRTT